MMDMIYQGTCWKFGDNISVDADLTKKEFSTQRETRLEVLRDYVMCGIDPDFPKKVAPHDIIVAGKRFAGLELGLVVESIPRGSFRNAVNAGVPFLPHCKGVVNECESGDTLRVNFSTGVFENLTRGTRLQYTPLDRMLLDIVALGGWQAMFKRRAAGIIKASIHP
jgi:3-isopropylmalate/(R)-2-methylmalate dehydratase small subunit